jgi:hypothetical protein
MIFTQRREERRKGRQEKQFFLAAFAPLRENLLSTALLSYHSQQPCRPD